MAKTITNLTVLHDTPGLLDLGWQVEDFRARLVTDVYDSDHYHSIAVSGTLSFLPDAWRDRFGQTAYTCPPLVWVQLPGDDGSALAMELHSPKIMKASGGPVRLSASETIGETRRPLDADDMTVKLAAFDSVNAGGRTTLPPEDYVALPIELIDEVSRPGIRLRPEITAEYSRKKKTGHLTTVGTAEIGSVTELFLAHAADLEEDLEVDDLNDHCPFEVRVPQIQYQMYDDTGFMLRDWQADTYLEVPVSESERKPLRQPRWYSDFALDEDLGKPARIVARIIDPDY
jgi:hypothetical protein